MKKYTVNQSYVAIELLSLEGNGYQVEEQGVSETDMTCLFTLPACQTEVFAGVELVEALVKGEVKEIPTYYFDGGSYCQYGYYSLDELVEMEQNSFTEEKKYIVLQYDQENNEVQIDSFDDLKQAKQIKQELNDQNEHFYFEVELVVDGVRTGTIA